MGRTPQLTLDEVFARLEAAAVAGERCPENGKYTVGHSHVPRLCRLGKVRVEISGKNWRTVFITAGRHAGKFTMRHPGGLPAWKIIDRDGVKVSKRVVEPRSQPSMVRFAP